MEQFNQVQQQIEENQAIQDEQAQSDHEIPDLNVQVVYEVEMPAQPDAPADNEAPMDLNAEPKLPNDLVLALPTLQPVNILPEEINFDQLMDVAANNVEDILQNDQAPQPMDHDIQEFQAQAPEQNNLHPHDPHFIGFVQLEDRPDPVMCGLKNQATVFMKPLHSDLYWLWGKHFQPAGKPDLLVTIPLE